MKPHNKLGQLTLQQGNLQNACNTHRNPWDEHFSSDLLQLSFIPQPIQHWNHKHSLLACIQTPAKIRSSVNVSIAIILLKTS
ncbi:hypothetical protein C5167_013502 [Papaver somniferum]|uniref:Uncharacterized protein n=1 Tax=Papaver somniferum TaxID=3469 RepID=A0A4Y7J4J0_PAPSO|nr:hypothetical protein C5167_013502 [Papaver somniferum]